MKEYCVVCRKPTGNGIIFRISGEIRALCPSCIAWSMDGKAKLARSCMATGKKGKLNCELEKKQDWAPFSTDIDTAKRPGRK